MHKLHAVRIGCQALACTTALLLGTSLGASAQSTSADQLFVTQMMQEARLQLAIARLAKQRAPANLIVTTAANNATDEWSTIRGNLFAFAYANGVPVRGQLSAAKQALLDRLGQTPQPQFARAYLRADSEGNRLALVWMGSTPGALNPMLQRFIARERPIVQSDEQLSADDLLQQRAAS